MKSPVQPFRPELLRTMLAARESQAKTLFDPVTVKAALCQAASAGHSSCLITVPLDLRETAAGERIVAWCAKEGLRADWSKRPAVDTHNEAAHDLVVSWGMATT